MKILIILLFFSLTTLSFGADKLPVNWRLPKDSELKDEWRVKLKGRAAEVKADFDGDKKTDTAKLLVNTKNATFGIFVFTSGKTIAVHENEDFAMLSTMGITLVKPGKYKTACGKGYWKCEKNEPAELVLKNSAIDFYKTESANSFFVWNSKEKKFDRIWISD